MRPRLLEQAQGSSLLRGAVTIKVSSEDSEGAFSTIEYVVAADQDWSATHVHDFGQSVWVLYGQMELTIGRQVLTGGPGTFGFIPPGAAHSLRNPGHAPARYLISFTPGGFERFYEELDGLLPPGTPWPPVDADMYEQLTGELLLKYGVRNA